MVYPILGEDWYQEIAEGLGSEGPSLGIDLSPICDLFLDQVLGSLYVFVTNPFVFQFLSFLLFHIVVIPVFLC